jgi:hypothetical protein
LGIGVASVGGESVTDACFSIYVIEATISSSNVLCLLAFKGESFLPSFSYHEGDVEMMIEKPATTFII